MRIKELKNRHLEKYTYDIECPCCGSKLEADENDLKEDIIYFEKIKSIRYKPTKWDGATWKQRLFNDKQKFSYPTGIFYFNFSYFICTNCNFIIRNNYFFDADKKYIYEDEGIKLKYWKNYNNDKKLIKHYVTPVKLITQKEIAEIENRHKSFLSKIENSLENEYILQFNHLINLVKKYDD